MSGKVYNFFQSTSNKCSPRHLECGFDIPAEIFPIRVKNFFAQGTNNLRRSRKFFKPKFFWTQFPGKQFLREKCTSCTKSGSARTLGSYFPWNCQTFHFGPFLTNNRWEYISCLRFLSAYLYTHAHTHTHTHTSNKKLTKRPGFYYKKLRKVSMAFGKAEVRRSK